MPANKEPIFSRVGDVKWSVTFLTAANTTRDGTTGTLLLVFTADNTNGSYVQRVIARPLGTNIATVLRIFINNGSSVNVQANNSLFAEITCPATTGSEVGALPSFEVPLNMALPPGYVLYATIGTTVAAGFQLTAIGGDY